jgi:hypothetical protein
MGGDLGGWQGADAICNDHARAAGRPGLYKAWICADGVAPASWTNKWYDVEYRRTDESPIARGWGDLTDGWIDNPIHYDEFGKSVVLDGPFAWWTFFTWTFVKWDGTCDDRAYRSPGTGPCPFWDLCPMDCAASDGRAWTSRDITAQGALGDIAVHNGRWTEGPSRPCDPFARLYCVEQ